MNPEKHFHLRFLLNPAYLAANLREIRSVHDFFSRFWNILRYIGFGLRYVLIKAGVQVHNGYYALQERTLLAGRVIRKAAETAVPAMRVSLTFLAKPLRFFRDARSDAALTGAIADFRPRHVNPEKHFRLRFLLNPAYLAARLREIRSVHDFFSRFRNILRYIGFELRYVLVKAGVQVHNGYFGLRYVLVKAGVQVHNGYYALQGGILRAGRAIRKAAEMSIPAMRSLWTLLVKPLWFFRDARSDAALTGAIANFRPRRTRPGPIKNPLSPLTAGAEGRPRFSWNIHLSCNYDCPYCWFHGGWEMYHGKAVMLSVKEWRFHWTRFNDRHGPAHIEIAGGEPFTYPGFADILAMLSERNTISVSTNFAWDPSKITGRVDPARVGFACSFHPKFAPSADAFAEKILRLREAGFCSAAAIVAYPPYLDSLVYWNDSFFSRGIHLTVQPFRGYWKGRYYPTAYTAAAKRALAWFINGKYLPFYPREVVSAAMSSFSALDAAKAGIVTSYQMNLTNTLGKLCNSGRLYGRLQFNGDMQRCSQGGYVGNFLSDDFRMYDEAKPCPFPTCECSNEALYMQGSPLGPGGALRREAFN